jgi:branched-chain amino acid transport system permease protein
MAKFIALLASAISAGAITAIAATGLMVLYKSTGVINFAHGDLITLGAYLAIWTSQDLSLALVPAYLLAIVLMFGVGLVMERVAFFPLRGRSPLVVLIATLGFGLVIRALISVWRGGDPIFLRSLLGNRVLRVAGANIAYQRMVIAVVAAVVLFAMIVMFSRTQLGRQVRALANDREMAQLNGVRVAGVSMVTFGLSASLAALAGVLTGPLGGIDLNLGFGLMFSAFAASIVGGFGNLYGVIVGSLILGLTEFLIGGYLFPNYASTYPFIVMLAVIAFKPEGLFGEPGSRL